jgi:hypothetical protein
LEGEAKGVVGRREGGGDVGLPQVEFGISVFALERGSVVRASLGRCLHAKIRIRRSW